MDKKMFFKQIFTLLLSLLLAVALCAEVNAAAADTRLLDLCREFNALNTRIRDNDIRKPAAKKQFRQLLAAIGKEYYAAGGLDHAATDWVFPLKGYGYQAIGGKRGGYQPGGYDYFDGNRHGGHPSQDIFIHDKKQQSIDAALRKPVAVLSVSGGVVVAAEESWDPASSLRGGKYLWIYEPTANALLYYAHNSRLQVAVGDLVKPGDVVAEVGRTGLNAHKKRSPTHLHLTCLSIINGLPVPRNIFRELLRSKLS